MSTYKVSSAFVLAGALATACGGASPAESSQTKAEDSSPAGEEVAKTEPAEAEKIEPAPPLTAEQEELIKKHPRDLSIEDRRKRAFAIRQRIMQNPDSPTAKALRRTAENIRSGAVQIPDHLKNNSDASESVGNMPPQI